MTDLLSFELAGRSFALPAEYVERVIPSVAVTGLGSSDPFLLGVMVYHGKHLPVLDLRRRLNLEQRKTRLDDRFLIMTLDWGPAAVPVEDRVWFTGGIDIENLHIDKDLMKDRFYAGLARLEDGTLLILDPVRFFSPRELGKLEKLLSRSKAV